MPEQKKDLVKEIFERSKEATGKVSTLFTHVKQTPKPSAARKIRIPSFSSKALPAAIDIGTSAVKLLQLAEGAKGRLEVSCRDKEPYSAGIKEALKKILSRNKISSDVVSSISARDVQIYNLTFPQMSEAELGDAIRWKITQLRPFGLNTEEIIYSHIKWQRLNGPNATQQRILLVCAPRKVVQERISLLSGEGLRPVAIEVGPVSLVNLADKDEVTIWLDIGANESTLVIARGDALYFCRPLALTSQHMTSQISHHCGVAEKEAEELKKEYGLEFWSPDKKISVFLEEGQAGREPQDEASLVYHGLISSLENLVVDIEHSFKYFSYQVTQSQITKFDRVALSGGGSALKNLDRFLSVRLGVPVERIGAFSLPAEFGVCAGLAAGQKKDEAKRINLVPKEAKKGAEFLKEHLKEKPVRLAAVVVGLALLLILMQIGRAAFYGWKTKVFTDKVRTAQVQLSRLQSSQLKLAEEEGRLLEKKAKLSGRLALLEASERKPEEFSEALAEVAALLPDEIWATRLTYSESKLNITGSTRDMNLIMQLIESLKSSENFNEAAFSYSQKDPASEVYNFEVIAEVKK